MEAYISLENCVKSHVYKLKSRNLIFGVYDGNEGFIGIRKKFNSKFLVTEYHWDQGPPHGTAKPLSDIAIIIPDSIELKTSLGTINEVDRRFIKFNRDIENPYYPECKGWWVYTDTGTICPPQPACKAMSVINKELFEVLENIENDKTNS